MKRNSDVAALSIRASSGGRSLLVGRDLQYAYPVVKQGNRGRRRMIGGIDAAFFQARSTGQQGVQAMITVWITQLPYTAPGLTWRYGCSEGMEADYHTWELLYHSGFTERGRHSGHGGMDSGCSKHTEPGKHTETTQSWASK
uniref:Uncharacterized protein n=1 Tax=Pipistrellus kuhlii TaxID=59472 RepID=A0A7J8B1Z6_PIPKU|nr:hypothetical protein mPipKuh1_007742 [Pipistrellus kuhlii]